MQVVDDLDMDWQEGVGGSGSLELLSGVCECLVVHGGDGVW